MTRLLTTLQYLIIGFCVAVTLCSAFYLGRITTHVPTPVCALGRSTEYPVLKPLYVKVLERAMPVRLQAVSMMLPPVLPRKHK